MSDAATPAGWTTADFGSLVSDQRIGTTVRGTNGGATVPLLKMGNLLWGGFNLDQVERVDSDRVELDELRLRSGDILFNTRNTPELVGKTAVWPNGPETIFDNNIMRIRLVPGIDPFYLGRWMAFDEGQRLIRSLASASTSVGAVYWRDLERLVVPLPPFPEQRRIAAVLDEWDEAIATTERLIAAKRMRKDALVQRLLANRTGSRVRLADLAFVEPASPIGVQDSMEDGPPLYTAGGFAGGYVPAQHTGPAVILSSIGARCGKCFWAEGEWTAGANTVVIRPHPDTHPRYLFQYLEELRPWPIQGSGQPYIGMPNAKDALVLKLGRDEQGAIAKVLDGADEELDVIRAILDRVSQQKHGLMQKLMTGAWRVPESIDELMPGGSRAAEVVEATE